MKSETSIDFLFFEEILKLCRDSRTYTLYRMSSNVDAIVLLGK